jgi:hypothetical protein
MAERLPIVSHPYLQLAALKQRDERTNVRSSILGMNFALVSVLIPAIVALIVCTISPLFTHYLWKRQKRSERKLAVAERYAVLNAEVEAHLHPEDFAARGRLSAAKNEMLGLLFVVPVLFQKKEVVIRAKALRGGVRNPETIARQRIELEAYLFAEALDVSFDKIPPP